MRLFPARAAGILCVVLFILFLFPSQAVAQNIGSFRPEDWEEDTEVTEVGKGAVRAKQFLDWTIATESANWAFLNPTTGVNRVAEFWQLVRNIAYGLTVVIILITAFVVIISRGRSINVRKQLLIIAGVFVLITFSFAIIDFLYRFIDTLQNFFLKLPNNSERAISSIDLLAISFPYEEFVGFRLKDRATNEAANVTLFLVKATSLTYYVMAGILLLRKIILWFFIILSPLWVLLLPFPLVRNTAKIWMGEFFRWLFYAPIFSVLLAGLVMMWRNGIPLAEFNPLPGNYPTAINILLGPPNQPVNLERNISNVNDFASYIFALLMLWVVILLPFLLLKIFRNVFTGFFKEDNVFLQKAFGSIYPFLPRLPGTPAPVPTPSASPGGEGKALEIALHRGTDTVAASLQVANIETLPQAKTTDIVQYAGLSVPSLRDLARLEMDHTTLSQNQATLQNIANPANITSIHERSKFSSIQQELLARAKRGDAAATTILAAAESAKSNKPVPIVVGGRAIPGKPEVPVTATKPTLIPTINRIQTVAIEDYEDVKKMWEENYRQGEIPISDKVKSREEWIKQDVSKIAAVVELISSQDEAKKKQGLEELAVILPFLLLGGFSDQETTVYLKAKLEAAKKVLSELEKKTTDEEEAVLIERKDETRESKAMEAKTTIDDTDQD